MTATEEVVVKTKLKIKYATKRIEAEPGTKSCNYGQNGSLTGVSDQRTSMKEHITLGLNKEDKLVAKSCNGKKFFAADHAKDKSSLPGVLERGPPELSEGLNQKRQKLDRSVMQECSSLPGALKRGPPGSLEGLNQKKQKLDRSVMQQCSGILKKLMTHPAGWVFNQPVDPVALNIPDYFSIISDPMDLGTIKSKLEKNLYCGAAEFAVDIRLTFSNAMLYNPPSNNVHLMAKELNDIFDATWKSVEAKWNQESSKVHRGKISNGRAGKINMTIQKCNKIPPLCTTTLPKKPMPFSERQKLKKELGEVLEGRMPPQLCGRLEKFGLICLSKEQTKVDIDALSDDSLWELRKVVRSFLDARAAKVELPNMTQKCRGDSLKNLHEGIDSDNRHTCASAKAKLPSRPAAIKCGLCGSITCQCNVDTDSNRATSSDLTSDRSLSRENPSDRGDTTKLDCKAKKTSTSHGCKSDPDSDGAGSALDDEYISPSSHPRSSPTVATSGEEWKASVFSVQLSPTRALRAVMLKRRFADTILKAQQRTLLDHGDKADLVKLQQEKEQLERKQLEERAKIEAKIRAAEAAAQMKAEFELKIQRQREREAARLALQEMEKSAEFVDNLEILKDLEMLSGCSLSGYQVDCEVGAEVTSAAFRSHRFGNPLERLGLFIKDDDFGDDDDAILNEDSEEGEIVS